MIFDVGFTRAPSPPLPEEVNLTRPIEEISDPYLGAVLLVAVLLGLRLYHPGTSSNGPAELDLGHA